jgi:hypothetical protein
VSQGTKDKNNSSAVYLAHAACQCERRMTLRKDEGKQDARFILGNSRFNSLENIFV